MLKGRGRFIGSVIEKCALGGISKTGQNLFLDIGKTSLSAGEIGKAREAVYEELGKLGDPVEGSLGKPNKNIGREGSGPQYQIGNN
jgi:hypothetical protein